MSAPGTPIQISDFQCLNWYWRSNMVNDADSFVVAMLSPFMIYEALVPEVASDTENLYTRVATIWHFICSTLRLRCHAIRLRLKPQPMYNHFICHKAGAAAQSRVIQLLIQDNQASLVLSTLII